MTANHPSTNVWDYKPWWCQPWSILLATAGVIGGSWFLWQTAWITGLIAVPMVAWAIYFVVIYPLQVAQYLAAHAAQSEENVPQAHTPR